MNDYSGNKVDVNFLISKYGIDKSGVANYVKALRNPNDKNEIRELINFAMNNGGSLQDYIKMVESKEDDQMEIENSNMSSINQFKSLVNKMNGMYSKGKSTSSPKVYINENDFKLLSKFEKNTLRHIATLYGILNDPLHEINYTDLVNVIQKLNENATDIDKHYLLSLLFPEKVKSMHIIYPFPIPTYTFTQKLQQYVTPNNNGCFLAQIVCPLLIENYKGTSQSYGLGQSVTLPSSSGGFTTNTGTTTGSLDVWGVASTYYGTTGGTNNSKANPAGVTNGRNMYMGGFSNFYIYNGSDLNGLTRLSPASAGLTPATASAPQDNKFFVGVNQAQCVGGAFNTCVLQCLKVSAKYVGRGDVLSGYFGGSYNLTAKDPRIPDYDATNFNFVDEGINATTADVSEGLNIVFYPPDYSYTTFNKISNGDVTFDAQTLTSTDPVISSATTGDWKNTSTVPMYHTNMRINLYGASLPGQSLGAGGVVLTYTAVWNVIPTPLYGDLLPLNYDVAEQQLDMLELAKFIPQSGLGAYTNNEIGKIERMMELPSHIRNNALNEFNFNKNSKGYKNILDVLAAQLGDKMIKEVTIDKSFLEKFLPQMFGDKRKDQLESMYSNYHN